MPLAQLQNGVAGLVHGNFDQAIQCFRESLVLAGQQEATLPGGGRDDSNTASLPEEGFTSSLETMSSHNLFSLYDRAFVPHAQTSAAVLSIICIYNIGFAHHMRAMTCAHKSALHLKKARHFYQLAGHAIAGVIARRDPDDPYILLALAIANNIGHIDCHFCDRPAMERTFQEILDLLPALLQWRGSVNDEDRCFFYSYQRCSLYYSLERAAAA
jgi:hypothetical protein